MSRLLWRTIACAIALIGTVSSEAETAPDPNQWRADAINRARATAPRLPDVRIDDWRSVGLGDIGSVLCARVYWKDHPAGWIADPASIDGALVGRACDPDDDNARVTLRYIVRLDTSEDSSLERLQPVPHLGGVGYFASPSWCGNLVAYWEDSLRIRSLDDKHFSIDTEITPPDVQGDMPDLYPYVVWSDDCGRLTVPADDDRKIDPISFTIPIEEARSSQKNTPQ